jgi:BirA family transcriptional regulator, biotin operon repressor / biotin---[acetyl-CoA-carboxylase] ligase
MRAALPEPERLSAYPLLSAGITAAYLGEAARHFALEFVAQCDSTNDALAAQPAAETGLQVMLAHSQTAGRGRRGRNWRSAPGQGLTFSCGWNLPDSAPSPAGLSLVAGLAVAEALESLGARNIRLKWPNDLLADGAKLGGILVELVSGQRRSRRIIIGIGLNLRSASDELPPGAAALHQHLGAPPADEAVLARILLRLHARLEDFATHGFSALRACQSPGAWCASSARRTNSSAGARALMTTVRCCWTVLWAFSASCPGKSR